MKSFKTDIEDYCEDEDPEDMLDQPDVFIKNLQKKIDLLHKIPNEKYTKMRYMIDCGFNLLIYGIGSKFNILNHFMFQLVNHSNVIVFNGFNTNCDIKLVVEELVSYFMIEILRCAGKR